jgi:hypothetical protein
LDKNPYSEEMQRLDAELTGLGNPTVISIREPAAFNRKGWDLPGRCRPHSWPGRWIFPKISSRRGAAAGGGAVKEIGATEALPDWS